MRKTYFIIGGIAVIFILLIVRLIVRQENKNEGEREWFAKALEYEFSAKVDTIWMFNNKTNGRVRCLITAGDPKIQREDSLKKLFKRHEMMYLIFKHSGDSILFISPYAHHLSIGDSLRISSSQNSIQIFRAGEIVFTESLSSSLIAYGKPPFQRE